MINLKGFILVILLFSVCLVQAKKIEFKVQFSENYAIFEFLKHLSKDYPENAFKKAFLNSQYNTEENQLLINEFSELNYFYWYEYEQYPYGNKIGGSTYFLLGRNLIEANSIQEFKTKSFGIIPNYDLSKFCKVLKLFKPIYINVVYNPSKEKFDNQLKNIRDLVSRTDISASFNKVLLFHNSTWDFNVPFMVSLYPIPDSRVNGFTATAFYNQAVGGIPQGLNDFELLLSVMFHEAYHIIYDEQSLEVKNNIAEWFDNHPSKSSRYAQLLFNEAVTTSLANGYLYRSFKGKMLMNDWYNNKYIAQMAFAMFPLVEKYINDKKTIDEEFIKAYINIFDNKFSNWLSEVNHLMMQRFVISESSKSYRTLYQSHRYSNISEYKNKLNRLTIEEMKSHPITKVIIVNNDNKEQLKLIKDSFNELKKWKPKYKKDFGYTCFLEDKTYLIVLNSHSDNIKNLLKDIQINF